MLELTDLRRRFGAVAALDGVTFSVPRGRTIGFVGRNGAGKTTTMRAVMGTVRPDDGTMTWDGRPVDHAARLRFGYLPEERGLYPKMKVRDQLLHLARLSGLAPDEASSAVDGWLARLGLGGRGGDPVDELSLGNQQRVQLAAALVHRPELAILDEPFSGLDPVGVDVMAEALAEEAARGAAVVFSSHQLELVERLCDDVVIIEAGRVVAEADDLLRAEDDAPRVVVEVTDARTGWADYLDGITVLDRAGDRLVVQAGSEDAVDGLLAAAVAAGRVQLFQVGSRSLAERFRDAVEA